MRRPILRAASVHPIYNRCHKWTPNGKSGSLNEPGFERRRVGFLSRVIRPVADPCERVPRESQCRAAYPDWRRNHSGDPARRNVAFAREISSREVEPGTREVGRARLIKGNMALPMAA